MKDRPRAVIQISPPLFAQGGVHVALNFGASADGGHWTAIDASENFGGAFGSFDTSSDEKRWQRFGLRIATSKGSEHATVTLTATVATPSND